MNTTTPTLPQSTYSLLVRSEERERNLSETAVYMLLIVSSAFSIWQFAHQPFTVPVRTGLQSAPIAQAVTASDQKA